MQWFTDAPSNIALIKYMGKREEAQNLPDNPSLSYTLSHLMTYVGLELNETDDNWLPLKSDSSLITPVLSVKAQARFVTHLQRIKTYFNYTGTMTIYSGNNFPLGVGIASSASSFAALTKCVVKALEELTGKHLDTDIQANLSRLGSGSSCRSFYAPWCIWEEDKVFSIDTPFSQLLHQVVVFSRVEKTVSSSEAHQRVITSPLYEGRINRAKKRLENLLSAMQNQCWHEMYQICFDEFMDMHALFETAKPGFSYRTNACHQLLEKLQTYWKEKGDGPLITMDAGSTIHLLYRPDQVALANYFKENLLKTYDVF